MTKRSSLTKILADTILLLSVVMTSACQPREVVNTPVVAIQKTNPSGDEPLLAGQQVVFEVDVRASGMTGLGQIGLVVQDSSGDVLATCDPVAIENNVTVRLRASTVVGNGPTMRVFTPLYLGSSAKTDVLDVRSYRVVGKADKPKASN